MKGLNDYSRDELAHDALLVLLAEPDGPYSQLTMVSRALTFQAKDRADLIAFCAYRIADAMIEHGK